MSPGKMLNGIANSRKHGRPVIIRAIAVVAGIGLSFWGTAFGRDSTHYVCSAVTSFQGDDDNSRIGISIVVDEGRGPGELSGYGSSRGSTEVGCTRVRCAMPVICPSNITF